MATVLLISGDLMCGSRMVGPVTRAGLTLETSARPEAAAERLAQGGVTSVVIDLEMPTLDLPQIVSHAHALAPPARVIAFGPHVHEAKLATAHQAGCDVVLTRGQFHAQLDALFAP